ncbi:MAG TPA: metallophosphoesterase [Acidimicrobiia bacterium]|nr:metallophosphoesterase [Acidimicrobiia bacterium]
MKTLRVLFLADSQLGLYASFSGMTDEEVSRYAELGMHILPAPRTEGHEWDARMYERAVAAANGMRPDLVLFGGDMIDDPNSEDQLDDFLAITARLDADIPVRYAPGNHDIAGDTVVPTAESIAAYRAIYGDDYYAFDLGSVNFLVLNTVVIDHPENVPGELEAQMAFVDEALTRAPIVVGHHPFFVQHLHEGDTYWNLPAERRVPLVERMEANGVTLSIAGHWHRNNIARSGDLEMVTSGPVGYPLGDDPSGFRVIDITEDGGVTHRYLPLDSD